MCSSTTDRILTGRPSVVESNWKSMTHTMFGPVADSTSGTVEDPTRLRRRYTTTRRPSLRHSR
ncbi:putative integrase, catalytic region [Rhodococcus sp. MTM3W5.2]|nr:putative integrase, catalytic region [Rhodococcus sp. MTM3W5.2]